ncbi:MAG: hypothetical protein M1153_01635, partial [Patescibacteria group bacterium]|nr:hypothetical protein [Patescibacteria group bacterium]
NCFVAQAWKRNGIQFEYPRGMNLALPIHRETFRTEDGGRRRTYVVPEPFCSLSCHSLVQTLWLFGAESGSGSKGDTVSIVCGTSGRPLKPLLEVSGYSSEFYKRQAVFLLRESGTSVFARRIKSGRIRITIRSYWLSVDFEHGVALSVIPWSGWSDEALPKRLCQFTKAVEAAHSKLAAREAGIFYADTPQLALRDLPYVIA